MNLRKITAVILALCAICFAVSSCGLTGNDVEETGTQTTKTVDAKAAAEAILSEVELTDALDEIDPSAIDAIYQNLPADVKFTVYIAGNASADEVAVFTSSDTAAVEASIRAHVADQLAGFSSYMPAETGKINNAVIVSKNGAVALVIAGDASAARSAAEKALS